MTRLLGNSTKTRKPSFNQQDPISIDIFARGEVLWGAFAELLSGLGEVLQEAWGSCSVWTCSGGIREFVCLVFRRSFGDIFWNGFGVETAC